jgi:ankyrin repeat protein
VNQFKQMNAYNTIVQAHENPHYVDRTTKDTIFHALSRVKNNDILQYLGHFVPRGINLNRHNRDGHHPLTAFICNEEVRADETGASMSKYIDSLIWKDSKRRIRNDINVDMMNRRGATALYEAAIRAQSDSVRSLIEAGANVNARLSTRCYCGLTFLKRSLTLNRRRSEKTERS